MFRGHQYTGESTHSTLSVPSHLKRHKPSPQKTWKEMEKYKCKIDNSSVMYTNIFVSVSDFQLTDSDY